MLMQPKKKNHLNKTEGKFRINSATTRRTKIAASNANDESRLTNFIQNENYEINSFRSNDRGDENSKRDPLNLNLTQSIRDSWVK